MKCLAGLIFLVSPLKAQLYADVSTTLGDFTVELYYQDSPKTVANFITLSQGTRAWVDSTTGEVKNGTPYYNGIIFHRVIEGFMNQLGSQKGDGSDGPGYTFPDEVGNGILHDEPYLLSSANSGPNTNGSQIFITVDETPWLNGIHTVFGKVTSGTSVIDTINQVPVNGSTPVNDISLIEVTIRAVGEAAGNFDPLAQNLPEVSAYQPTVEFDLASGTPYLPLNLKPRSTLNVYYSSDLSSWSTLKSHRGPEENSSQRLDLGALAIREFYRTSVTSWPEDALFPGNLEGHIIEIDSSAGVFTIRLGDTPPAMEFSGSPGVRLIDMTRSLVETDGYGALLLIYADGLVPIRFRLGADLPIGALPAGKMTGTAFTSPGSTSLTGTFTLTAAP